MSNEHPEFKVCVKCDALLPITSFYKRQDTGKLRNECKECFLTHHKGFVKLMHYTNYQSLWAADNLKKGSSV